MIFFLRIVFSIAFCCGDSLCLYLFCYTYSFSVLKLFLNVFQYSEKIDRGKTYFHFNLHLKKALNT